MSFSGIFDGMISSIQTATSSALANATGRVSGATSVLGLIATLQTSVDGIVATGVAAINVAEISAPLTVPGLKTYYIGLVSTAITTATPPIKIAAAQMTTKATVSNHVANSIPFATGLLGQLQSAMAQVGNAISAMDTRGTMSAMISSAVNGVSTTTGTVTADLSNAQVTAVSSSTAELNASTNYVATLAAMLSAATTTINAA